MTGMDHGVAVRIEQTQPPNYRRLAVNGTATVIETFESLLDSRALVAELEKIELVEACQCHTTRSAFSRMCSG
jgi:hypothetical protein